MIVVAVIVLITIVVVFCHNCVVAKSDFLIMVTANSLMKY